MSAPLAPVAPSPAAVPLSTPSTLSSSTTTALDSGLQLTLIEWVELLWLGLNILILASPFIRLLTDASQYGKLAQVDEKQKRINDTNLSTSTTTTSSSPFLHPVLYIRTSTAFLAYYIFAFLWNIILIAECLDVLVNHSFVNTPTLNLLRSVGNYIHPSPGLQSTTLDLSSSSAQTSVILLLLQMILFECHLFRRLLETIFVANFSSRSKQHGLITFMGLVYYFLCVLTPVLDSPIFDSPHSGYFITQPYLRVPCIVGGLYLFWFGWYAQHKSHVILANLRQPSKEASSDSTTARYEIPYGELFEFVSMPHYFCEMLEYTGLFLFSGLKFSQGSVGEEKSANGLSGVLESGSWPHWMILPLLPPVMCRLICIWVYSNLSITGIRSHRWYQQHFPNYPTDRKAVIPYVL